MAGNDHARSEVSLVLRLGLSSHLPPAIVLADELRVAATSMTPSPIMPTSFALRMLMSGLHPPRSGAGFCGAGRTAGVARAMVPHRPDVTPGPFHSYTLGSREPKSVTPLSINSMAPVRSSSGPVREASSTPSAFSFDSHPRLTRVESRLNPFRVQLAFIPRSNVITHSSKVLHPVACMGRDLWLCYRTHVLPQQNPAIKEATVHPSRPQHWSDLVAHFYPN